MPPSTSVIMQNRQPAAHGLLAEIAKLRARVAELEQTVETLSHGHATSLEQCVAARTRALSTLLAASNAIASTLELQPLLGIVLDQLKLLVDYSCAAVCTVDGEAIVVRESRGPMPHERVRDLRMPVEHAPFALDVVRQRTPCIIDDLRQALPLPLVDAQITAPFAAARSWMGIPLLADERMLGLLSLGHAMPHFFTPQHASLALALANQAARAMENASLYAQAQTFAVLQERQRLARDLHDTVTQTLFSTSLIAEVLPLVWKRRPAEGQRRLGELRELTRGALAEMRLLLLELRPAALTEVGLDALLRQLAEAVIGRTRLRVSLEIEGQRPLPPDVQIALYRIAQEALNNTVRHARARMAVVRLRCLPAQPVELQISDDGVGFDPACVPPGHLGLGMMDERAHTIGAQLTITSRADHGTQIRVIWPCSLTGSGHA